MLLHQAKALIKRVLVSYGKYADRKLRRSLGMVSHDLRPAAWNAAVSPSGHLEICGMDVTGLAETYGTPLHVADSAKLKANYSTFLEAFRSHYPRVEIGYSYKTNPVPGVLALLKEYGASAEVISPFELWLALELGMPPHRIIVNGPGKTEGMLDSAVAHRVKIINMDNLGEAALIQRAALRHQHRQAVGVRVVTSVGWSSQFGFNIRSGAAERAFREILKHDHLEPCGIHFHLGTGLKNVDIYLQAIGEVLDFVTSLREKLGIRIRYLDLGGGFGVPTVRPYSTMDRWLMADSHPPGVLDTAASPGIATYGGRIARLIIERFPEAELPTLILEPGRSLTSSAQTLLLKVLAVKSDGDSLASIILDGGVNVAMPTMWEYHEILAANKLHEACDRLYRVCGPLCHPGDILAAAKRLPAIEPGDLVAVMDAGAYFIPNQMNFSHPRAAVVLVEDGKARLIRQREQFSNLVALDAADPASAQADAPVQPEVASR